MTSTNDAPAPAPSEDPRWQQLRDMLGLDGWHDGHFHGAPNPDQIVTHIQHVANERARLMLASAPAPSGSGVREACAQIAEKRADELRALRDKHGADTRAGQLADHCADTAANLATAIRASLASDASPRGEAVPDDPEFSSRVRIDRVIAHPAPATVELREAAQAMLDAYDRWVFNDEPARLRAALAPAIEGRKGDADKE